MKHLTFIVPAYGKSQYLEACIKSLTSQTVKSQILITTSTPNDFINQLGDKYSIQIICNNAGGSISKDWNFALECGSNNLVTLAHQDDLYHSQYAEKMLDFFNINPNSAIAFTDSIEFINGRLYRNNKRELTKKILRKLAFLKMDFITSKSQQRILLGFGCSIPCPSVTFNRSVISDFHFSDEFTVNLDWDAWSRLATNGLPIGYVRGALLTHRIHSEAETQKGISEKRREKEDLTLFMRFWPRSIAKVLLSIYRLSY